MKHTTNESFLEGYARGTDGLEHASTGACPGCKDCGLAIRYILQPTGDEFDTEQEAREAMEPGDTLETQKPEQDAIDIANEGGFSWSACDFCGSTLGGNRYPAHAWLNGALHHFEVCADCLCYEANGELPFKD